jgi:ClpP class serine protease
MGAMSKALRLTIDHADDPAPGAGQSAAREGGEHRRVSAFDLVASMAWAIQPDMLETIAAIARRENESPSAVEARLGRPLQNARTVSMRGGVAVVPITGPVFRYANLMTEVSGATSLEVLARDFTAALDDPAVASIVLAIDSPGGQASGIAEFAQMVRASSKPVVAYVDGYAASAAYWIASAAGEIVMSKTGEVGSIGAVIALDGARARAGMVEIVSSQSPKKRPDVATDEGRAQIQARIDKLAQVFVDDVAAYRGVAVDTVLADFGQGDMRMGEEAVALGMADRVGTLEEVIAALAGKQAKPAALNHPKGHAMNIEELRAAHPDLVSSLLDEGRTAGAAAERARILEVEAQALPGHEALIAQLKADGATTGPMAAVAVLAAERAVATSRVDAIAADAPAAVPFAAAPADASATDADASPEDRARAAWDADPSLRAEFGAFDTYLAYAKANAAGMVKVLSK